MTKKNSRRHTQTQGILIIGGGILQIPALQKAKELGLITYLTDGSKKCAARNFSDYFFQIDTKDINKNIELAKKLKRGDKIKGVYTQGTDVEYTVACAANAANLPGISSSSALSCNNKVIMRKKLLKAGFKKPKFAPAGNFEQFKSAIQKVGFPCYVKPVDNSASRGITRLTNNKNLETIFNNAINLSFHSKEVIVETEIEGEEYSIDTVIYNGKLYPAGISDRAFLKKEKYAIQSGSRTPSLLPSETQKKMYLVMEQAAKALGIDNGAFKGDLAVDKEGNVEIIEVTARTSGGFDSQYRKPLSFGIDIMKATIDIALGNPLDPTDLVPKWIKWSSTISTFPNPGVVKKISGLEELRKTKGVARVFILCKIGDKIEPYVHSAQRTNFIICYADTLEKLIKLEKKVVNTLKIITTNKKNEK